MVTLKQLNCPNCGAPLNWDGTYDKPLTCPYCGSQFMPGPTEVGDVRLMTDPVARARFEFNGTLDKLEHDIRYEVLRGGSWRPLDRECKGKLDRLEQEGIIRKLASFWALSPFPPMYRARQDGELSLGGRRFPFHKAQELVGLCSYLLIGFWFEDLKNAEAAKKAFVVNRVGDLAFILGVILIFWTFGSHQY